MVHSDKYLIKHNADSNYFSKNYNSLPELHYNFNKIFYTIYKSN